MKINNYEDIKVTLLRKTNNPLKLLGMLTKITMTQNFKNKNKKIKLIIKKLLKMNHTSLFEFIEYTFIIENASRSFLSQITRHRHASYCSSSQHYQNYSKYPHSITKNLNIKQRKKMEK
ncbi:MAG: FAD-dependent thymidylate synthase [Halanaerobiales bacterium]|nr:FAD-dependent thymidylate synthase [Halanaerobiales bacterium]